MTLRQQLTRYRRHFIIGVLLLLAAAIASYIQPAAVQSLKVTAVDLEKMIPMHFDGWQYDPSGQIEPVPPELASQVEATYSRTLGRSYVDQQGRQIMLSIAYGSNQLSDRVQAHRPEYCYRAQGFKIGPAHDLELNTAFGQIPLRQLIAMRAGRQEPVSYWMIIGDQALLPGWARKLAQLRYGLLGEIPDGLLIRVSSISDNPSEAYSLQEQFIADMLANLSGPARVRLIGPQADIPRKDSLRTGY